jgi:glycosyltransferase involved in cell wall biosynthesis
MHASVALCTYNGEKFVVEQLTSILRQKQPVDEIIVCDDCSTDTTVALIQEVAHQYPGRITLLQNPRNIGAIRSFEKCIQACSGDIIFLSDQDDVWQPNKTQSLLAVLAADAKALAVFSNGELINEQGQPLGSSLWEKWNFPPALQQQWRNNDFVFAELVPNRNVITGATLAFKKELLPLLLPFELPAGYWHDAWIGLVAAGLGGLRFLAEPTIRYRIHQHQQVGVNSGAGDKRFEHVSWDYFLDKLIRMFPKKRGLIRQRPPFMQRAKSLLGRMLRKIIRVK